MMKEACLQIINNLGNSCVDLENDEANLLSAAREYIYTKQWGMNELEEMKDNLAFQVEQSCHATSDPQILWHLYKYASIASIRVIAHGVDIGVFYTHEILANIFNYQIDI